MNSGGRDLDAEFAFLSAFTWDRELAEARVVGDAARIIRAIDEVERRGNRQFEPATVAINERDPNPAA